MRKNLWHSGSQQVTLLETNTSKSVVRHDMQPKLFKIEWKSDFTCCVSPWVIFYADMSYSSLDVSCIFNHWLQNQISFPPHQHSSNGQAVILWQLTCLKWLFVIFISCNSLIMALFHWTRTGFQKGKPVQFNTVTWKALVDYDYSCQLLNNPPEFLPSKNRWDNGSLHCVVKRELNTHRLLCCQLSNDSIQKWHTGSALRDSRQLVQRWIVRANPSPVHPERYHSGL